MSEEKKRWLGLRGRIALIAAVLFTLQAVALLALNGHLFGLAITDVQRNLLGVLRDTGELDRCDADPAAWSMHLDGGFVLFFLDEDGTPYHPDAPVPGVAMRDAPGEVWGAPQGPMTLSPMLVMDTGRDASCRYLLNVRDNSTFNTGTLVGFWGRVRLALWVLVVPAIVLLTAGPLVRRIRKLSHAAAEIIASDFRGRLPVEGGDELDELAADFNRVAEEASRRIDELRRRDVQLTEQLANLSHDVRTPLAALKLGLENSTPRRLTAARAEVEYLDGLFSNLARSIQLEATGIPLERETIPLHALVERVCVRFQLIAADQEVSLHAAIPAEPLTTRGDSIAMEQAVGNLVHNAVKFAEGNVAVLLYADGEAAIIEVRDDGPGFEVTEIPRLTERSYRGRTQSGRSGLGLGLAIAATVAEHAGGTLTLARDEDEGGSIATLRLPVG